MGGSDDIHIMTSFTFFLDSLITYINKCILFSLSPQKVLDSLQGEVRAYPYERLYLRRAPVGGGDGLGGDGALYLKSYGSTKRARRLQD